MPEGIDRDRVRTLMASGAQIVDVLPADEYREEHLPGAVNIPLRELDQEAAEQLDRTRPVIVYCNDHA
jgi:rhodanese-related sulfurtransferase